jgi:hypothetical protein
LHLLPFFAKHRLSEITVEEVDRYRAVMVREADRRRKAINQHREAVERRRQAIAAGKPAGKPIADRDGQLPRPLTASSINKTLTRLGLVLEDAVEYGHLERNPARGRRRRLKAGAAPRPYLDRADHIDALLDAAGHLDRHARTDRRHVSRRAPRDPRPGRATDLGSA